MTLREFVKECRDVDAPQWGVVASCPCGVAVKQWLKDYVPLFLDWISVAVMGVLLGLAFMLSARAQVPDDYARQFQLEQAAQQALHEALQRQAREDQARALREQQLRDTAERLRR